MIRDSSPGILWACTDASSGMLAAEELKKDGKRGWGGGGDFGATKVGTVSTSQCSIEYRYGGAGQCEEEEPRSAGRSLAQSTCFFPVVRACTGRRGVHREQPTKPVS